MPTIAWFHGVAIRMFYNDHAPPHLHAFHGAHEARFAIETGELLTGALPRTQRRLVQDWISMYRERLMDDWRRAQAGLPLERIPGPDADNDA
jgi:hypothetical protein